MAIINLEEIIDFNNISLLNKLTSNIQVAAITSIFFRGVLQASRFYLDRKINSLKAKASEAEKKKDQETISNLQNTISLQENKIDTQLNEIQKQKAKLAAVESQTRPRRFTNDAMTALKAELLKHQGESISITCIMGDQETFSFASDLKKLFESSGWNVDGVNQSVYTNPIKRLIIVIKNKTHESRAQYLFDVLKTAGFHCTGELNEKASVNLGIVVGAKE